MEYKPLELRVGLTVFIATLALVIGLMWFQGFKISRETYELSATFPMALGATPGDKVYLNGVEMGKVKRVRLRERDVLITMEINARAKVPDDSRIVLQTIGIMGERIVTIMLGVSPKFLERGAVMEGVYDPGIAEALAALGNIMGELTQLTKDMQKITTTITQGDKLKRTVENLAEITATLNGILKRDTPEIDAGLRSMRRSAERVDGLLARNETNLDTIMSTYAAVGRDLPELVRRASGLTDSLSVIMGRLQRGDNTLGALVNDRVLLEKLEKTIQSLDELIADVKAHPKKYLKVSIF